MNEEWRPVPGYEGTYEVSNLGRVRSVDRLVDGRTLRGRVLRPAMNAYGYPVVSLNNYGAKTFAVHILVARAFLGPPPEGHEMRHLDGNPLNAAVSNLRWGTHSENIRDKRAHGTDHNVAKTHCPQGHPYSVDNTYVYKRGRTCRTCQKANRARYLARKREASEPTEQPVPAIRWDRSGPEVPSWKYDEATSEDRYGDGR